MVGLQVVVTKCDADGNVDLDDLRAQVRAARREPRRGDDHLPVDLRRVRARREGAVRAGAPARRPRLRRRREHERAGRRRGAGRVRRRREPPEPAQDLLHPARRRRPRRRPGLRRRRPGALPAGAPIAPASAPSADRRRLGGAAGQRRGAADQLDVHAHDGRRRPDGGDRDRDPLGQLHRRAARRPLRHPLQRQHRRHPRRRRRARMHPRPAAAEGGDRRRRASAPRTSPSA